jgi:hypothetical protein
VTNMDLMFAEATLCTDNYDNLLNGWAPQAVKTGIAFYGGYSNYSTAGAAARDTLIRKGWTISDIGLGTTADAKCIITAIEDEWNGSSPKFIYPNPTKEKLTIHFAEHNYDMTTYAIFNSTGLLVLEKNAQNNGLDMEIELNHLPSGVYVLKMKTTGTTSVHSFVKE